MSKAAGETPVSTSVFQGTEQRLPYCDFSHVLDSFNVEFIDKTIRRRPGRQKILNTNNVRPSMVITYDGANYTDVTSAAIDGNTSTVIATNLWNSANAALFIGCPFRFTGVTLTLANALSSNTTLTVGMPVRTVSSPPVTFNTVPGVVDGTVSGGFTLKQTGTISWAYTDWASQAWTPGGVDVLNPASLALSQGADLYWIRLTVGALGTGGNVTEAKATFLDRIGVSVMSESSGMTEFVTKNGRRLVVSTNNFPSQYNDSTVTGYAENRAFVLDMGRGDMVPVRIPQNMKSLTVPNRLVTYATFNGFLIGATPAGQLWKYDGVNCTALESLPGMDVVNKVLGASGYSATPMGTMLEVYRNRLAVTGNSLTPLTFQLSIEDNNISVIPTNATVGGPNVWPLRYIFNVPGKQGDRIMGASVINDRYCILTRNQLWVFDDSSLKLSNADIGCASSGSVCRIDNSIFFLSDQGICTWDSVNVKVISDPIWDTLYNRINWKALDWATSVHHKNRAEYWLWLPMNGESKNQIAAIYNYKTDSWRFAGSWYPFDTDANRDAGTSPAIWSTTAACPYLSATGRYVVLSSDATGALWQEAVGYEDNNVSFPAYVVFRPLGSQGIGGENYALFRSWYLEMDMDGSTIIGIQLGDGQRFDREVDAINQSIATYSQTAQKQALTNNAVAVFNATPTYASPPSYPVPFAFSRRQKLKLSFGQNLTWMQPALIWLPTANSFGSGTLYGIQFGEAVKPTGR